MESQTESEIDALIESEILDCICSSQIQSQMESQIDAFIERR